MQKEPFHRIGLIGTGFIARGFNYFIAGRSDFQITKVLTRRKIDTVEGFHNEDCLTNDIEDLLDRCDIVVELSGGLRYTAENVIAAHERGLPVVTLNADFHVTYGSQFVDTGLLTEAAGDQPGCMAELKSELINLGFTPLVYGNIKGYQNYLPSQEDMQFWSRKQGISEAMCISATNGTKIQMEAALIANGLNAEVVQTGMIGFETSDLKEGARYLAQIAEHFGSSISDFLLNSGQGGNALPKGIFIVASHDSAHSKYFQYYKLGTGPFYLFHRPYYLPHLEVLRTIVNIVSGEGPLLNNSSQPKIGVCSIANCDIQKGTIIRQAIGSYDFRGTAFQLSDHPEYMQMGLLEDVIVKSNIAKGKVLTKEDIDFID